MAAAEGRLSRWSRLKQKGGASETEEKDVAARAVQEETALSEADELSAKLPGGVQVRNFVPAMPPLAPEPEDDDDRLTRGIGHVAEDEPAAEGEAAQPNIDPAGEDPEELFAGIEETELSDEEKEVVAGLPPLDSLTQESDFTPFFKDGVPEFLKRKAMRILWRSNPIFGIRDGLNDYDEDFNVVHKIIEETVGAYKVGRGHLSDEELQDMMPEQARRAFDEEPDENDDEAEIAAAAEQGDVDDDTNTVDPAQSEAEEDDETVDDLGDGEDDPTV